MEPFEYAPLGTADSFRLLKISVTENDQLQCVLEEHILLDHYGPNTKPPSYAALSYTWGDADSRIPILCDGNEICITKNLFEALLGTRSVNSYEYIWVDQICINQSDSDEKSKQVGRMTRIYDMALTVLAWLGPDRLDTKLAIEWIQKVASLTKGFGDDIFRDYENGEERRKIETYEKLTVEQSVELGVDFNEDAAWTAFSAFYDSPWYERIWVVQELLPAREALVVCGSHSVDWHMVKAAAAWYLYKAGMIRPKYDATRAVDGVVLANQMNLAWNLRLGSEFVKPALGQLVRPVYRWLLTSLSQTFRTRLATDPRDKIYALLGISDGFLNERRDRLLHPDYTKPTAEVFRDVVRGYLKAQQGSPYALDLLWEAIPHSKAPGIPSWVPDWRFVPEYNGHGGELPKDKPVGWDHRFVYNESAEGDEDYLLVEGLVLGQITHQSQWDCSGDLYSNLRASRDEFLAFYCQGFNDKNYVHSENGNESVNTSFIMSLTAGELWSGFREKSTAETVFAENAINMVEILFLPSSTTAEQASRYEKLEPYIELGLGNDWAKWAFSRYCERRWYMTDTGFIGIGNHQMQHGDVVAALWGLDRTCILRPLSQRPSFNGQEVRCYALIGEAYCRGAKSAIDRLPKGDKERPQGDMLALR